MKRTLDSGRINKLISLVKKNDELFSFIISLISFFFIFLRIILGGTSLGDENILGLFLNSSILLSGIFTILFLPSYPIFFMILRQKKFNFWERFTLTIIINISFYILVGYFGYLFGIPINSVYFYLTAITFYLSFIILNSIIRFRKGEIDHLLQNNIKNREDNYNLNFSLSRFLKNYFSINLILLIIFLGLVGIFLSTLTSNILGTDAWLHSALIRIIVKGNTLPVNDYFGAMGLHIFSSVFYFFTGIEISLIPQIYYFYTIPLSALLVYILLMRIFKNHLIALFGVFISEFHTIGYFGIISQFWPTSLALIQLLAIFFLLYTRMENLMLKSTILKKDLIKNVSFIYPLTILMFISSVFTHSLVTLILLITYLWIYLIYFVKDYKRAIDIVLLCGFLGILTLFYSLGIATGHFNIFSQFFNLPLHYLIIGLIAFPIIFIPMIWKFSKLIPFGKPLNMIVGSKEEREIESRIEKKKKIPLIIAFLCFTTLIMLILDYLILNISIFSVLSSLQMIILMSFSVWGYYNFSKTSKGYFLYIWVFGFSLLVIVVVMYDIFVSVSNLWPRILSLSSAAFIIGFLSYFYRIIKLRLIKLKTVKIILISLFVFFLTSAFLESSSLWGDFSLDNREIRNIQFFSEYTDNRSICIIEYGHQQAFIFYDYPYESKNLDINAKSIHEFIYANRSILNPETQIINNTNILQKMKEVHNAEVFIFLSNNLFLYESWQVFDSITEEEMKRYYNLTYLNKVCSSKDVNGQERPIYWVI